MLTKRRWSTRYCKELKRIVEMGEEWERWWWLCTLQLWLTGRNMACWCCCVLDQISCNLFTFLFSFCLFCFAYLCSFPFSPLSKFTNFSSSHCLRVNLFFFAYSSVVCFFRISLLVSFIWFLLFFSSLIDVVTNWIRFKSNNCAKFWLNQILTLITCLVCFKKPQIDF